MSAQPFRLAAPDVSLWGGNWGRRVYGKTSDARQYAAVKKKSIFIEVLAAAYPNTVSFASLMDLCGFEERQLKRIRKQFEAESGLKILNTGKGYQLAAEPELAVIVAAVVGQNDKFASRLQVMEAVKNGRSIKVKDQKGLMVAVRPQIFIGGGSFVAVVTAGEAAHQLTFSIQDVVF
jgi:hypothetical protein